MRRSVSLGAGVLLVLSLGVTPLTSVTAGAATATNVLVTNADLIPNALPGPGQFAVINQGGTSTGGAVNVLGPATPPLGVGSLQMTVTGTSDHWSVYTDDWAGTPLSSITSLGYSTFTTNTLTDPALQVVINPGTPSSAGFTAGCISKSYSTLNFEPYLQSQNGGVVSNVWQTWNVMAANAVVWASHLTSGTPACTPESPGGVSLSTFVSYYPNAVILPIASGGGVGVNVGSGWTAMTGNVDALTVGTSAGTTVYNFEPSSGNRPFTSNGSGTETSLSASECQFTSAGCTVQSKGTAISTHLGKGSYTSTLTINWSASVLQRDGGWCAPATGTGMLTAANGDTLTQYESGTVCETGPSSLTVPHSFIGSFYDTGGTGRFANASGEGTVTGGDNGYGASYFSESGTIGY